MATAVIEAVADDAAFRDGEDAIDFFRSEDVGHARACAVTTRKDADAEFNDAAAGGLAGGIVEGQAADVLQIGGRSADANLLAPVEHGLRAGRLAVD